MDKLEEDFFNLKFKDLSDNIKHECEQRDEFLNHAYSIDRRLRTLDRAVSQLQEHFGIDPTPEEDAEASPAQCPTCGATEGQANAVEVGDAPKAGSWLQDDKAQTAVMLELFQVFHGCKADEAVDALETSPRYNQWQRLAKFVIEHAGIHG